MTAVQTSPGKASIRFIATRARRLRL